MQHATAFLDEPSAQTYVLGLYETLLARAPLDAELAHWIDVAQHELGAATIFQRFIQSDEFLARQRLRPAFPIGHYYSPIVDPAEAKRYVSRDLKADGIPGIALSLPALEAFWHRLLPFISLVGFGAEPGRGHRFHYRNATFEYGDAMTLFAMIGLVRPRRIVEIGSGFSSVCMLDALDRFGLDDVALTCIDPDPARLRGALRPDDVNRIEIVEAPIQTVGHERFAALEAGDILFVDSTHVLKTGSDVHRELFSILPMLAPGVFVHVHDIQYPFEYPDQWIFEENFSWNEIYAIRAFLMYNSRFEIVFWGSCLASENRGLIAQTCPDFLKNTGGSLWLRVV